jgi:gluconokinase
MTVVGRIACTNAWRWLPHRPTRAAPFMIVVLMGVSGSGKSTIGRLLASRLGWTFLEGDEFHPAANREKLAAGQPLTDADRWPWLAALNAGLLQAVRQAGSVVVACSALKESYRDRLDDGLPPIRWVHLTGDPQLLEQRLEHRVGHFSSTKILPSQLDTLERPVSAVDVHVDGTPAWVVEQTARGLGLEAVDPGVCDRIIARNVFANASPARIAEQVTDLVHGGDFRLESILSTGQATPAGIWLTQDRPEWVVLCSGGARLRFDGDENPYEIAPGDAWLIPARCRHRVEWTDPDDASIWLALHFAS